MNRQAMAHAPGASQRLIQGSTLSPQIHWARDSVPRSDNKPEQYSALPQQGVRSCSKSSRVIHAPATNDHAPAANDGFIHAPVTNLSSYPRSQHKNSRSCRESVENKSINFSSLEAKTSNEYLRFSTGYIYLLVFYIADLVFWFTKALLVKETPNVAPKQNHEKCGENTILCLQGPPFVIKIVDRNDKSHAPVASNFSYRSVINPTGDNYLLQERAGKIGVTQFSITNIWYPWM